MQLVVGGWTGTFVALILKDVLDSEAMKSVTETALAGAGITNVETGCTFAWEGEVPNAPSAPLNWAFGCSPGHPFVLFAMRELVQRVLSLRPSSEPDALQHA